MNHCVVVIIFFQTVLVEAVKRECGLPANLASLPDFAREEIIEIWKNYHPGTGCQKELEIESDIIDVINSFDSDDSPTNNDRVVESTLAPRQTTSVTDYDPIGINGGTPIPLLLASSFTTQTEKKYKSPERETDDYLDQTTFDDVAMMQFDSIRAPFLRTASSYVKEEFRKIWEDQNIPSESLRTFKIQMLAVSLLSSKQLSEYNRWATKRRRVLKAREQEMSNLSVDAKQALRKLSVQRDDISNIVIPQEIKKELSTFVQKLNRRRSLKLVH